MNDVVERITMMEWFDATTPCGRTRSFRLLNFNERLLAVSMVGEKQMGWVLRPKLEVSAA